MKAISLLPTTFAIDNAYAFAAFVLVLALSIWLQKR